MTGNSEPPAVESPQNAVREMQAMIEQMRDKIQELEKRPLSPEVQVMRKKIRTKMKQLTVYTGDTLEYLEEFLEECEANFHNDGLTEDSENN